MSDLVPTFSNLESYAGQDLNDLEWEELVSLGMEARILKDFSQWLLGKLALAVEKKYGSDAIGKFAKEIGVKKSSLVVYRWVVKQFEKFIGSKLLPSSHLPFSAYQVAAGTENPSEWIRKAADNDWSVEKLATEIKKHKDPHYQPKKKTIVCPRCKFEFEI